MAGKLISSRILAALGSAVLVSGIVPAQDPAPSPPIQTEVQLNTTAGQKSGREDYLIRRAEDGTPRAPNPNGSNAGVTPGLSKNDYVTKTYQIHNTDALQIQTYLLRPLAYEGGIAEVMGSRTIKETGSDRFVQFLIVTAPPHMIPGIDSMVSQCDVPGFAFSDGTGNAYKAGDNIDYIGAQRYVGRHRTASELKSILIGTELGNIGQFYYAPFADNSLNTIYFTDNPVDNPDNLAALAMFDRPPIQAEFSLLIYEVEDDTLNDIGLDWDAWKRSLSGNLTYSNSSSERFFDGDGPESFDTLLSLDASAIADFLNFLTLDGKAQVVTETKLLSVNSEDIPGSLAGGDRGLATAKPAVFKSIRPIPYSLIVAGDGTAGNGSGLTDVIDPSLFEGIVLTIRPFIATESITADVSVVVNSFIGFTRETRTPNIASREANSVLSLKNGVTHLVGAFDKETLSKRRLGIPGLKEIPILKYLFSRETDVKRTSKIIVLITPRIVTTEGGSTSDLVQDANEVKEKLADKK